MPLLRMNLTTQSQLVNNQILQAQQIQQAKQAQQRHSLFRLGSSSNRNMMSLLITGNKSCQSCGGK
jgi:hypothetical protein